MAFILFSTFNNIFDEASVEKSTIASKYMPLYVQMKQKDQYVTLFPMYFLIICKIYLCFIQQ